MKLRLYSAIVTHRDAEGRVREEAFPVRAADHPIACEMALDYVLAALKLKEFELRIVGS
ncbi:MAG TPA: hypothetical protein VF121_14840 [Thermoanaerobaculia bacterium]|nr:hypothetical protein [Thermoanaerobaculia bacterium]